VVASSTQQKSPGACFSIFDMTGRAYSESEKSSTFDELWMGLVLEVVDA
jgi:hypothetical protein